MLEPVTVPIPLIESEVAPLTLQARTEVLPDVIVFGVAVKAVIVGPDAGVAVPAPDVSDPPPPHAVNTSPTASVTTVKKRIMSPLEPR